ARDRRTRTAHARQRRDPALPDRACGRGAAAGREVERAARAQGKQAALRGRERPAWRRGGRSASARSQRGRGGGLKRCREIETSVILGWMTIGRAARSGPRKDARAGGASADAKSAASAWT